MVVIYYYYTFLFFLTDAFLLFKVSKKRVPSEGVLHGDLQ